MAWNAKNRFICRWSLYFCSSLLIHETQKQQKMAKTKWIEIKLIKRESVLLKKECFV